MMRIKEKIAIVVGAVTLFASSTVIGAIDATPTASTVLVNGNEFRFNAYNIDGYNYFKLRDIAYVLNGSEKQFDVGYDVNINAILLTTGKSYTIVGGEMEQGENTVNETTSTTSKIVKDGIENNMPAYNINGNNYFKLRDLGEKFNFGVDYDEKTDSIVVNTKNGYTNTPMLEVPNIADDSDSTTFQPTPMPLPSVIIP